MDYSSMSQKQLLLEIEKLQAIGLKNDSLLTQEVYDFFESRNDLIIAFDQKFNIIFSNQESSLLLRFTKEELSKKKVIDIIDENSVASTLDYIDEIRKGRNKKKLNTTFLRADGKKIQFTGSLTHRISKNGEEYYIAVLIDNTERVKAEVHQSLYYQIAHLSIESDNVEELLAHIHTLLKEHIYANNFGVALVDEEEESISYPYYVDEILGGRMVGVTRDFGKGLPEYVFNSNEPVLLRDTDIEKLIEEGIVNPLHAMPKIWVGVPLRLGKRITGVIAVKSHSDREKYSKSDLDLLDFISGQLALVIERKRYEDQINENRAHLKSIFDSSRHMIWTVNRRRGLTSFNQNYFNAIKKKYNAEPIIDPTGEAPRLMLSASQYHEEINQRYQRAFNGEYQHFQTEMNPDEGDNVWRETYLSPIILPNGKIEEVTGISHDITEKKLQELALKESEAKFRSIFESFQDIYMRTTKDGTITMMSPSGYEKMGFKEEEVLGKQITEFTFSSPSLFPVIRQLLLKKKLSNFEITLVTKKNKHIPSLAHLRLLEDSSGKVSSIDYVIRDVTLLKRVNEELYEAKEFAERTLEVKENFLANMSHEIRTPMNGMIAMIDLLNDTVLDSEQKDYVSTIKTSSNILLNILNDILDLSKLEANKMKLRELPLSIEVLIEKVYSLFNQRAFDKGLKLKYAIDSDVPKAILGDETRLLQILSNLVSNAIKFTEKGQIRINISLEDDNKTNDVIRFEIVDTGVGITDVDKEKLFKNFNQLDNSITKSHGGTGLGLSISQALCRLMGGEIRVDSQFGKGSVFHFCINPKRSEVIPEKRIEKELKISQDHFNNTQPSILLVDDNSVNRRVGEIILRKAGCKVDLAVNGDDAILKILGDTKYDLIYMDIQMPIKDGLTATKELKEMKLDYLPPIVAMTAFSLENDRERLLNDGLDDYIAKPITAERLISKTKEVLMFREEEVVITQSQIVTETSNQSIDLKVVNKMKELGGVELLQDVFADFISETEEFFPTFATPDIELDIKVVLANLHTLKGISGTIGLTEIADLSKKLEFELKQGNFEVYEKQIELLKDSFLFFKDNYKTLLDI